MRAGWIVWPMAVCAVTAAVTGCAARPSATTEAAAEACRQGEARMDSGDPAGAREAFTTALGKDPVSPEALYGRGRARFALGDPAGSIEDFDAALRTAGGALLRSARPNESGTYSDRPRALFLSRLLVDIHVARGMAREASGDVPGAREDFQEARRINADQAEESIRKARSGT